VGLPVLDWVFLAVLAASLLLGAWRGLVYEVLSVVGWIAAFVLAQWWAPQAAAMLPLGGTGEALRYAAGFAAVFIGVVFAAGLLAWLIKKAVEAVGLRPINMTPLKAGEWWKESTGAGASTATLKGLKPVLPERFGHYLPG
jgi:membrane protein required for colicin V production